MDAEIREYLIGLVSALSSRDAMSAVGYSQNSFRSFKALLNDYSVELPKRKNQYDDAAEDPELTVDTKNRKALRSAIHRHVEVEQALVIADLHGTEVDRKAFSIVLAVLADLKPRYCFLDGDIVSFDSIARFSKDPRVALILQDELDQGNEILDALQEASPGTEFIWIEGNHELRLRNYLRNNARELAALKVLKVTNLFRLEERGIKYIKQVGKSGYTRYGAITIGHFDKYSAVPASVAKWFLEHRNESVIQAHTHKRCQLDRRFPDGTEITAVETGCLCKLHPDYVTDPDWAQGFVLITKRTDTDRFHINAIRIIDHEALVGDVLYTGVE